MNNLRSTGAAVARLGIMAAIALASSARAQTYRDLNGTIVPGEAPLVGCSSQGGCVGPVSAANPLPVTGTLAATVSGFTPGSVYATPLSVSTSPKRVALPSGPEIIVYNTGATSAYVQLGGAGVTANSSNDVIPSGGWMAFAVGSNSYLAAITAGGATSLNISGGSGTPAGAGGGGAGAVLPTGPAGTPNASVLSVQGVSGGSALPVSGTFWQATQPVSLGSLPALPAGTNTIGAIANTSFGISGTLPAFATTPTVIVGALPALPSGVNSIGAVQAAGTVGADYSANKPALPNVGASFPSSGSYANYVLIATVAASTTRNNLDVENTSGGQIAIVRDDGTAASGAAPSNASVFALGGGAQPGAQGGSWTSQTFRGRVQIYAPSSTAQVAVFVD